METSWRLDGAAGSRRLPGHDADSATAREGFLSPSSRGLSLPNRVVTFPGRERSQW